MLLVSGVTLVVPLFWCSDLPLIVAPTTVCIASQRVSSAIRLIVRGCWSGDAPSHVSSTSVRPSFFHSIHESPRLRSRGVCSSVCPGDRGAFSGAAPLTPFILSLCPRISAVAKPGRLQPLFCPRTRAIAHAVHPPSPGLPLVHPRMRSIARGVRDGEAAYCPFSG